jgi:hypothetical protein
MTLGNMRANGVRCRQCHHETVLSPDRWPDAWVWPAHGCAAELFGTVVVIVGDGRGSRARLIGGLDGRGGRRGKRSRGIQRPASARLLARPLPHGGLSDVA